MSKIGRDVTSEEERRLYEKVKPTSFRKPGELDLRSLITMPPGSNIAPYPGRRLPKVHITENSVRVRVKDPIPNAEFRTHDVGREGYTKRIVQYNPTKQQWETQAWLFKRSDLLRNKKTRRMFREVLSISRAIGGKIKPIRLN